MWTLPVAMVNHSIRTLLFLFLHPCTLLKLDRPDPGLEPKNLEFPQQAESAQMLRLKFVEPPFSNRPLLPAMAQNKARCIKDPHHRH